MEHSKLLTTTTNNKITDQIDMLLIFAKESHAFDNELKDIKELYDEIKTHYDQVKISRANGTLEFLSNQAKNLITIKTTIINIIKEKVNIKKTAKELELKVIRDTGDGSTEKGILSDLLAAIYDKASGKEEKFITAEFSKHQDDEDIDKILSKRVKKELKHKKEKEEVSIETLEYKVVFDKHKNQYLVDKDYKLIDDYEVPKIKIRFKKSKKTGIRYAKDKKGNKYELIDEKKILFDI
jgi:hypothetical protein